MLYWDGEEIGQSTTIARFLAKKVGLAGKVFLSYSQIINLFSLSLKSYIVGSNDIEIVRADLVAENANEALCKYWDFRFEEDAAIKARGMAAFKATVLPNFLKQNSVFYQKNGGKFANGKDVRPNSNSKVLK